MCGRKIHVCGSFFSKIKDWHIYPADLSEMTYSRATLGASCFISSVVLENKHISGGHVKVEHPSQKPMFLEAAVGSFHAGSERMAGAVVITVYIAPQCACSST